MLLSSKTEAFKTADLNCKTIAANSWAQILVEKQLYRKPNDKHFFVHVIIKNTSDKTIAFDLGKRSLFYINQWFSSTEPQRNVIDEIRLNNPLTTQRDAQYLIDKFNKKRANNILTNTVHLIKIKPQKVFDYYIAFNNGSYKDIQDSQKQFIVIVMDGHMLFTNGQKVQILERDASDDVRAEIAMAVVPNFWKKMPALAEVFIY
jgi:hypothetical protein